MKSRLNLHDAGSRGFGRRAHQHSKVGIIADRALGGVKDEGKHER